MTSLDLKKNCDAICSEIGLNLTKRVPETNNTINVELIRRSFAAFVEQVVSICVFVRIQAAYETIASIGRWIPGESCKLLQIKTK